MTGPDHHRGQSSVKTHPLRWVGGVAAAVAAALIVQVINGSSGSSSTPSPPGPPPTTSSPSGPPTSPASRPVFLSDLSPAGDTPDPGLAIIQGVNFRHSIEYEISLEFNSKTSTYTVPDGATRLRSYLGIDPRDSTFGSPVSFTVYVGNARAYVSPTPVDPNARACSLELLLSGAKTIRLQMDIGGERLGRIYAAWADARFTGAMDAPREPKAPTCAGTGR